VITEPFTERLERETYRAVYACGPMGLLARLARILARFRIPGQAALETTMGCGYGACLGCAVPHVHGGFALCCTDGPVFSFDEVVW
jgi:dihydroorotate dehydrogenase electron transfer subunit